MSLKNWLQIVILGLLLCFCIIKYTGCFPDNPIQKGEDPEIVRLRNETIQNQTFHFFEALKDENLDKATEVASLRALESVMKVPVDYILEYDVLKVESDKFSAEVETIVNGSVRTIVYLKKEDKQWQINSVISEKKDFLPL